MRSKAGPLGLGSPPLATAITHRAGAVQALPTPPTWIVSAILSGRQRPRAPRLIGSLHGISSYETAALTVSDPHDPGARVTS